MADSDLFAAEEAALKAAVEAHARADADAAQCRDALGVLIGDYRRLLRETRRVIIHSDRQERELTRLNTALQQLAAELDHKSKHDPLTGAYNRRAVIERTEALLRDYTLAMIVLDIDHFKRINDELGHPAGDAVIVELVGRLRGVVPHDAEIGRVGGEEFTVVIPRMALDEAAALAERMRAAVADSPFTNPCKRIVSASFGVSFSAQGSTFDDAYSAADAALYRAKRAGRNSVACETARS